MKPPPPRIETARLLLRAFEPTDTDAFAELLEGSREHYSPFISHFLEGDPSERVRRYTADFAAGLSFSYAAFEGERLVGGGGLFPRIGPGALEIGYHVRVEEVRRGFATEIASALAAAGFDVCGAERLEMHIDPANTASLALPTKLGFAEVGYDAEKSVLIFSRVRSSSESSTMSA